MRLQGHHLACIIRRRLPRIRCRTSWLTSYMGLNTLWGLFFALYQANRRNAALVRLGDHDGDYRHLRVLHNAVNPEGGHGGNLTSSGDDDNASHAYLRSFRSFRPNLKFLHVPKTAGTAIEYTAWRQNITAWGSCMFNHHRPRSSCEYPAGSGKWGQKWPEHGWWHVPRQFFPMARVGPYANSDLFAVVRHPYRKMLSEFYYMCSLQAYFWRPNTCNQQQIFNETYMNQWVQTKLKFHLRNENEEPNSSSLMKTAQRYLKDNGHFTQQHEFIVGPYSVRMIDYIIRLENIESEFASLAKAFFKARVVLEKMEF